MTTEDKKLSFPVEAEESINSMSNFDCAIDSGMEEDLRNGMTCSHSAWNFYGKVWFQEGLFHEEIWVHRFPREIISCDTLRGLMDIANEKYGSM